MTDTFSTKSFFFALISVVLFSGSCPVLLALMVLYCLSLILKRFYLCTYRLPMNNQEVPYFLPPTCFFSYCPPYEYLFGEIYVTMASTWYSLICRNIFIRSEGIFNSGSVSTSIFPSKPFHVLLWGELRGLFYVNIDGWLASSGWHSLNHQWPSKYDVSGFFLFYFHCAVGDHRVIGPCFDIH